MGQKAEYLQAASRQHESRPCPKHLYTNALEYNTARHSTLDTRITKNKQQQMPPCMRSSSMRQLHMCSNVLRQQQARHLQVHSWMVMAAEVLLLLQLRKCSNACLAGSAIQ